MKATSVHVTNHEAAAGRNYKIALTGLFAALSYVVFTFLQIKITLPGGDATSIHLGNAVCVLGALLIGGTYGGVGGAIGMTIGDLMDPIYVVYAPKTFILKFCIGFITGFVAKDQPDHGQGPHIALGDCRGGQRTAVQCDLRSAAGLLLQAADPG